MSKLIRAAALPQPAVDIRGGLALCGMLLMYLSVSSLVPLLVALGYGEPPWPFLGAGAIAAAVGFGLSRLGRERATLGFREGYLVVSLTWLLAAVFGALPYLLSGETQLDRPVDALFESMSGFTTTGSSVLTDIQGIDHSLLIWRQFTQWLGGMGIIVLALAVLPRLRVGGRQLLESALPGSEVDNLAERVRSTAQRLWLLYGALTLLQIAILTAFGVVGIDHRMGLFEAVSAGFATLSTGGFMPVAGSFTQFAAATQWVTIAFMVVAGANFALTYRALARRRPGVALRDEELRLYLGILAAASLLLVAELWGENLLEGEAAIRGSTFQVVSMMTTTGFASVDYVSWPTLAALLLVALMFVGGTVGSAGGSIKVVRHLLIGKVLRRELRQTVHPEIVMPVRMNGAVIDERTLRAVIAFALLYVGTFVVGAAVIAIDTAIQGPSISPFEAIASAATTLGNVGPGFGASGPMGSYAGYSDVSTMTMAGLMWLGRLEVIPILLLATRHYWRA